MYHGWESSQQCSQPREYLNVLNRVYGDDVCNAAAVSILSCLEHRQYSVQDVTCWVMYMCRMTRVVVLTGGKFMIIDMGGGTVDMTIHRVDSVMGQEMALSEVTHRECLPEV